MAKALVPAIAQQMRTRSSVGKQQGGPSAASAANYAAAGMATRAAGTLVRAAREHLRRQVADLAALAADIQEDETAAAAADDRAQGQQQLERGAAGARGLGGDDLSAAELAHIQREVAQAGAGQAGTPEQLAAAEVSIAPAAALQWTAGWVRWVEWVQVGCLLVGRQCSHMMEVSATCKAPRLHKVDAACFGMACTLSPMR